MIVKWWLLVKKQEMTRIWDEDKMVPVTLLKIPKQTVLRHKTQEKDGYNAVVIWADQKKKGWFGASFEIKVTEEGLATYPIWSEMTWDIFEGAATVRVTGTSKGKWFQWGMKRHNFGWWPETHWSKFHRALGSTGNRKPRRTLMGQKMAWHMGDETITLKSVPVVEIATYNEENFLVLKGSVPGAYHTYLEVLYIK